MNVRFSVLLASPLVVGAMLIAGAQEPEVGSPSDAAPRTAKFAPAQGPQQAPSKVHEQAPAPAQAPAPEKQGPAPAKGAAVETAVAPQYVVYAPSCPTCQVRSAPTYSSQATYRAPATCAAPRPTYSAPRTSNRRGLFGRYR